MYRCILVIAPGISTGMNGVGTDINLSGFVGPGGGPILHYVQPPETTNSQIIVSSK